MPKRLESGPGVQPSDLKVGSPRDSQGGACNVRVAASACSTRAIGRNRTLCPANAA